MNIRNKQVNESSVLCERDQPAIVDDNSSAVLKYQKPMLISYGDVRDITLGPSPGFGESGAGVFFLQP